MNWAERELLKAIAKAMALLVAQCAGGGGYHSKMIYEKLKILEDREEAEK